MSRKGKLPISIPKGVEVKIVNNTVSVKGPKGSLTQTVVPGIIIELANNQVVVSLDEQHVGEKNIHGLYRSLIDNMVRGVTTGFEKKLEMIGVGYRAAVKGTQLDIQIGFSHPTALDIPKGVEVKVEKNTLIMISGIDKRQVGQFAAEVRQMRPPEPYQGKGIRYQEEYVRRKAGKAAGK